MLRSLFAGVSGLRNQQFRMDVIGNNIANASTVAFKGGRVNFKETFAQLVRGGSRAPSDPAIGGGGTNPLQVGLGMSVGGVDTIFSQGNLENTGSMTDLAVQGSAFFVVAKGAERFYTRAGNFQVDGGGRLVAPNGLTVQGRTATNGVLGNTIGDLTIPLGQRAAAKATTSATLSGNLNVEAATGATREVTITVYDSLGAKHELEVEFTKTATPGEWDYDILLDGSSETTGQVTFNGDGTLDAPASDSISVALTNGADDLDIDVDFGTADTASGLSQFAGASTAVIREQDGYTVGDLREFTIDQTGTITGAFTNGTSQVLGQLVLADFNNPSGLVRSGDNMYSTSPNSGSAVLNYVGEGSKSSIVAGALEMSNVDLAQEFTNMITAQRGFQSNARVISASDEMLQDLVNLRR